MRFEFNDNTKAEIVLWGTSFSISLLFTSYIQIWVPSLHWACAVCLWELPVEMFNWKHLPALHWGLVSPFWTADVCQVARGWPCCCAHGTFFIWAPITLSGAGLGAGRGDTVSEPRFFPFSDFLFSFMCCLFGLCLKLVSCPPVFMESRGSFGILQCVAGPFNRYFLAFIYPAFLVLYVSFQLVCFRLFKDPQHFGHNFAYLNIFLPDLISHKPPKGIKSEFQEACLHRW